jgi:hypothetical protein
MKNPRRLLIFLAGTLAVSLLAITANYVQARREDTGGAAYPELLLQIPPGASTVIFIDLAGIRGSAFFKNGLPLAPLKSPEHDYAAFVQATGFDYQKDLDRAAIALWPPASPSEKYKTLILAEGRFDQRKIRDYAMRNGKIQRQQQHDVFVFPAQNPQGSIGVVFLNDHRLAVVEGSDAAPVLEHAPASNGDPASTNDPLLEQAAHIDGAPVFAISRIPAVPDNFNVGGMQSAQLASIIRSLQWVTLAARPEGDTLRVSLEGVCRSDTDARQMKSLLEVLRSFGQAALNSSQAHQKMDPTSYKRLQTLLQTAEVSQSAERVRIRLALTPDALNLNSAQTPAQIP